MLEQGSAETELPGCRPACSLQGTLEVGLPRCDPGNRALMCLELP